MVDSLQQLSMQLRRTPVIGRVHPLLPLALSKNTRIVADTDQIIADLDSANLHDDAPLLIMARDMRLDARFPFAESPQHPPIDSINQHMGDHLDYARRALLTNHKVASHIENAVRSRPVDVIVLLLIDGLSYEDVLDWGENVIPCFIDGPSVTFRFHPEDPKKLIDTIGFTAITNQPSVFMRLFDLGYRQGRGFTYWQPEDNAIADRIFSGLHFDKVNDFAAVMAHLEESPLLPGTYIQVVRQGLDGLAHSKREVRRVEIEATIQAVRNDVFRLCDLLRNKAGSSRIYLTADHGILWRDEHSLEPLGIAQSSPRFSSVYPAQVPRDTFSTFECDGHRYHLFRYPFLGSQIPANDRGVHGGLSYQESIVPFMEIEV